MVRSYWNLQVWGLADPQSNPAMSYDMRFRAVICVSETKVFKNWVPANAAVRGTTVVRFTLFGGTPSSSHESPI